MRQTEAITKVGVLDGAGIVVAPENIMRNSNLADDEKIEGFGWENFLRYR